MGHGDFWGQNGHILTQKIGLAPTSTTINFFNISSFPVNPTAKCSPGSILSSQNAKNRSGAHSDSQIPKSPRNPQKPQKRASSKGTPCRHFCREIGPKKFSPGNLEGVGVNQVKPGLKLLKTSWVLGSEPNLAHPVIFSGGSNRGSLFFTLGFC